MKFIDKLAIGILLVCFFASSCLALEIAGVNFPDSSEVSGKTLKLNGVGLRTATFFKIKVYAAALYLEEASNNAENILQSSSSKSLVMQFVRGVGKERVQKGWQEAFAANNSMAEKFSGKLEKFNSVMEDVEDGDRIEVNFFDSKISVKVQKKEAVEIEGADFAAAVLRIWLGPKPPNEKLKSGLLGAG